LYAIGENHVEDNADLHLKVIKYIQQNVKVDVVILELPEEIGKIINSYVLYGDKQKEMENLLLLLDYRPRKNISLIVNYIKDYNLSVTNDEKIQVKDIDFISFPTFSLQAQTLSIAFPEFKNSNIPVIDKYINNGKKRYSKKKGKEIINLLIEDATQNKKQYESQLGIRTTEYMRQLDQIKLNYIKSWRKSDSVRESILSHNLNTIIDSNKVSVLICGAMHALNKEHDSWFHGYPFTSMLATAKSRYPGQTFSIVTQYYDKKLFRFFGEFNLLSNPNALYFEDRTKRYEVLTKEELKQHPKADARCDMVIVQNTRWKKKKDR